MTQATPSDPIVTPTPASQPQDQHSGDAIAGFPAVPDGAPIRFKTLEHTSIGDKTKLRLPNKTTTFAKDYSLKTVSGVPLSLGRIVGLAGDYYTVPGSHAITGDYGKPTPSFEKQKMNAKAAAGALSKNLGGYLKGLQRLYKKEKAAVQRALDNNQPAAVAYHEKKGIPTNTKYSITTRLMYPRIAWNNFDHFGQDALSAYTACHSVALDLAAAGGGEEALKEAYFMDGFGLHFLTDIFSSGHVRVPRRALHDADWWSALPAGAGDIPVWDTLSRYFHDEDSACGLLVQNQQGDEWIAYGDKQYFDGHSRVNRLRLDRTIQASIDEVYDTFVSRKSPDPSNYIALKQSPIAQTAIATARSAGWNHDNSSPLWIYNPMEPSNKLKFTSRLDVNDHSSYDRETAYPGYVALQWPPLTASKKAASIKASQYVLSGEYPYNKPMEPTSGGFVQIQQHLDAQKTTLTSHANVWGPISALVENEGSLTFSLRTRTRGISSDPANLRTQEWASYFYAESGKSSFVRFTHDGNPSHELKVDAWSFFMNQPDPSSQIVSFSDLDTSKLTLVQDFTQEPIAPQYNSRGLSSAQFMLDTWISTDAAAPDIISVTFSSEAAGWVPRITVSSSQSGLTAPITKKIDFADIAAPKMAWTHIKFLTVNGGKRLLLANAVPTDDRHTLLNLRDYTYDESTCSLVVSQTVITLSGAGALPTQVLVGDVLGTGFQQLVVTTGNKVQLFNVSVGGKGQLEYMPAITPSATATATAITGNTFFMALVPAEDGLGGLEILTVISKTDEKAKSLKRIIEFIVSTRGGEGVVGTIEDTLYLPPHYVSLAWKRASYGETQNAVMEVFSWFGMLGTRLFAPKVGGAAGEWALVGMCTSLGQISGGTAGLLEWGPTEGWVDYGEGDQRPEI